MILEKVKNLDVQKLGDMIEGITAGISEEAMPFVFRLVSKQLYSNPIGSIIREITSNCFDSHIEAGVTDPVVISQTHSIEEGYAIEFKDVGVGLSPDRVEKVFMNWFTSTKREDNSQIGGFGIGSKTPLAYAEMFYITTIFNGLKYEYVLHEGESKPTLESLLGYDEDFGTDVRWNEELEMDEEIEVYTKVPIGEATTERNGTVIKIIIERNDISKFINELKFQLAYFDDVYFKGWGISNDYDIYEGDYFKFRSDMHQQSTETHLCIGKVRYPIDFSKVVVKREYMNMPVAVKFEIGELQVTPSRENLRYSPESITLIKDRIEKAYNELIEMFNSQNPVVDTLKEFVTVANQTPKITFDEEKGHVMYLWQYAGVSKNFKFRPLSNLNIKKTPTDLFFMWEKVGYIASDGTRHNYSSYRVEGVSNQFILNKGYVILDKEDRTSTYTDLYIVKDVLPLYNVVLIKRKEVNYAQVLEHLGIKDSKAVGKAKTIKDYLNIMNSIVHSNGIFYKDHRATDEWIAEYKRSIRESTAAFQRKMNKQVFVRDVAQGGSGRDIKVSELTDRIGILVYGFKEDKSMLEAISNAVLTHKKSIRNLDTSKRVRNKRTKQWEYINKREKAFMVIQIAKNVEGDILPDPLSKKPIKTIYCKDFFKTKFWRKIETSKHIDETLNDFYVANRKLREKFIRDFKKDYDIVKATITDYNLNYNRGTIPSKYLTGNLITEMLLPLKNFIKKHSYKIPFLGIFKESLYEEDLEEAISYLKYKKVKLKTEFYLKSKEQLKYEAALKQILNTFKYGSQQYLLTYTLNQTENVNKESDSSSQESNTNQNSYEESSRSTEESSYTDPF